MLNDSVNPSATTTYYLSNIGLRNLRLPELHDQKRFEQFGHFLIAVAAFFVGHRTSRLLRATITNCLYIVK
jgi:hypothetical protein